MQISGLPVSTAFGASDVLAIEINGVTYKITGATLAAALQSMGDYLTAQDIANNLTTTDEGYVLDARQGKALLDTLEAIGASDVGAVAVDQGTANAGKVLAVGNDGNVTTGKAVRPDVAQTLTAAEQAQARGNIGAASATELAAETAAREAADSDLKSAISNIITIPGQNMFNKESADNTDGSYINSAGNISTGSSKYGLSGLIPINPNTKYIYQSRQGGTKNRWYDMNKTVISAWSNETEMPVTATSPSNAYYVQLTYGLAEKAATQLNEGESLLPYTSYVELHTTKQIRRIAKIDFDDYATADQVDSKLDKLLYGTNLFNQNDQANTAGYYLNSSGNLSSSASYGVSDYIAVEGGKKYTYTSKQGGCYCVWYDSTKTIIDVFSMSSSATNTQTAPDNAAYIRVSYGASEIGITQLTQSASAVAYTAFVDPIYGDYVLRATYSMLGQTGMRAKIASLSASGTINIPSFPCYLKKNVGMSFYGKFSSFSGLKIGKGYNSYRGDWIDIGTENIVFHHYEQADQTKKTVAHSLTIADYIMVNLYFDKDCSLVVTVNTTSGSFTTQRETDSNVFSGTPFATAAAEMANVQLSIQSGDLRKPLWLIGDSYFGVTSDRVLGQLKALGYWDGFAADGLAGLGSAQAWDELNRMLGFGMPKTLIWYLGMNDSDSTFTTYLAKVTEMCAKYGIELILNKVPTVPQRDKETIGAAVVASGKRYIDSYAAVGANSSGVWYTGFIETATNPVHPTVLGAEALAHRFIVDVPEVMMYGYANASVSGNSVGDN